MTSIEETIQLARLQQAANSSSLYERKHNQKALKVLTVAAYILFVSMAAIILSFYYVFIWDPTSKPIITRPTTNCDSPKRIVIPENIAIRLANSTEVSAENFFRNIYRRLQKQEQKDRNKFKNKLKTKVLNAENISNSIDANSHEENNIDNIDISTSQSTIVLHLKSTTTSTTNTPAAEQVFDVSKSFVESKSNNLNKFNPSFGVQSKEHAEAYVDDEDLDENDFDLSEASGANRIRNETSILYNFDGSSDSEN